MIVEVVMSDDFSFEIRISERIKKEINKITEGFVGYPHKDKIRKKCETAINKLLFDEMKKMELEE